MERKKRRIFARVVTKLSLPIFWIFLTLLMQFVDAGTVGWFYALEEDRAGFEKVAGPPVRTISLVGGTVAHEYRVGSHKVVAARMGSGCVDTAVTVARVLALNPVGRVITTGPAGGIGGGVKIGEWVEVSAVVGWQQGRAGDGGRIFPKDGAERAVDGWEEKEKSATGDRRQGRRHVRLVSGEVFVASSEKRGELAREFKAELVEMNALGLLAAVEGMKAEVMVLRVVSDLADEQASEDFATFLKGYGGEGGTMVAELVKALPVGKDEPGAHGELKKLLED
jgi:adenosylhomocysteine nucleosidase